MFKYSFFLQAQTSQYIVTGIAIGLILFLLLCIVIVYFVISYQKRQQLNEAEKQSLQAQFEDELLKTENEVKEATLKTIAGELHDNIGQMLSITSATLSAIQIEQNTKAAQKLHYAKQTLNDSIKELRQLAKLLHAESLLEEGIVVAISEEADRLKRIGTISVEFTKNIDDTYKPNQQKELFILRLVQESISNCIKHADATKMHVALSFIKNELVIIISDNGKGFDTTNTNKNGMGLNNMHKRASLIGGSLIITSNPEKGTAIQLTVPYV